jgi:hypothetical protein
MRRTLGLLFALAMLLAASPACAEAEAQTEIRPPVQARTGVRVGNHPGYGRIVFNWRMPPVYTLEQDGDEVVLRFPTGAVIDLTGARRLPRNMVTVTAEPEGIRIMLRPGAQVQHFRVGASVVVDALDPVATGATPVPPERTAATARPAALQPPVAEPAASLPPPSESPTALPPPVQSVAVSEPPPPMAAPAPAAEPASASLPRPAALAVRLIARPGRDRAIVLPYPAGVGAAVLRRGTLLLVLFDSALPLDLTALRRDPVFAALDVQTLPDATLLRLPLASPAILRASRDAAGWRLEASRPAELRDEPAIAGDRKLAIEAEAGVTSRLVILANQPGRVVPVTDPESGMPMLLGTVREGGQFMPIARRLPELDIPVTVLGAAVLARADEVTMQAGTDRFLIGAGSQFALDVAVGQPAPGHAMTRSFDLPGLTSGQLLDRLRRLNGSIAGAPPLTRLPLRRAAGETLLALGLPQEAQSMLGLAPREDPQAATDPRLAALAGAAALLAGRPPEAMALRTAALPETDELTLWRGLLAAALGDAQAAAPGLAATLPLLLDYPETLRARLLPAAAQALAEAGAAAPLRQLLDAAGPDADLALPRAMLAEAAGETDVALAGYDQVARGRDRQARARALRRAIELRLATGLIDAAAAAQALDAALFAWRGDAEEIAVRGRIAELRRDSGDARGALALLQETTAMFPETAPQLKPAISAAFLAALTQGPALSAVALFDAYPEMLPADAAGEAAMLLLADRLVALDLGGRAAELLGRAAARTAGPAGAALGLRQALLQLADDDAHGALAALEASKAQPLPEGLATERAILAARAQARLGQRDAAVAALQALGAAGAEPLSQMLLEQQDWAGAAAALAGHLRAVLPAAPAPLDEQQRRLVLRQAALLVLSGDEAALARLREAYAPRVADGPLTEAFTMLTADQLRGLTDLPRLQRELQLFRSMPSRLEALRAGGSITR